MFSSAAEVLKFVKSEKVEMIDLILVDLSGRWRHVTMPVSLLKEELFTNGIGTDSSSYVGFKDVHNGDMRLVPDYATCFVDPFAELKTLDIICDIVEPDGRPYNRCPRTLAKRTMEYMSKVIKNGKAVFGLEIEWYLFNGLRYACEADQSFFFIDAAEAGWNSGRERNPNIGYSFQRMQAYHAMPPGDRNFNMRSEMVKIIESLGIPVQYHHHETGAPGQNEITIRHTDLLRAADSQLIVKYVVKNVCHRHQTIATFMPKPVYHEGGNAGHIHQSIVDENGISLFYDPKSSYYSLSKFAMYYIGGLLTHARALCALTNPSTNSYKRLVPGYEAPTNLYFSASNRTAGVRIPGWEITPKGSRVEYRPPDSTCVQYLSLSAQIMAALDGIERKIDASEHGFGPYDMDITKLPDEERAKIGSLPASLGEAFDALEKDHDFLLKGGVFDEDLLNWWIKYKRANEVLPVQLRPHPYEFILYTDV